MLFQANHIKLGTQNPGLPGPQLVSLQQSGTVFTFLENMKRQLTYYDCTQQRHGMRQTL